MRDKVLCLQCGLIGDKDIHFYPLIRRISGRRPRSWIDWRCRVCYPKETS